jgi:Spy/CpxP family protein refolding chaperone
MDMPNPNPNPNPKRSRRFLTIAAGALALSGLLASNLAATGPAPGRRLGLSDDQKEQIRGILKSHSAELDAQRLAARGGRKALREAMAAQPVDETRIRQQALALGEVRADGAVLRARIRSEIWPILTTEQQEKARQLRSLRGQREKRRHEAFGRWLRNA